MKAVVIHAYGSPEELKFEDHPDPMAGPGEVLVRVVATPVNPIDIKPRSGQMKEVFQLTFPAILGADVSGIVEAVGPDVQNFAPGDNVFANAIQAYASLCVVKAADIANIPNRMDVTEAAALPTVTMTGAQLAEFATGGRQRGTLLVMGAAGNVGRSAVFAATRRGWVVIAGVRKQQTEDGQATGADRVIALDDEASIKSLELLDAVADTISGLSANEVVRKSEGGRGFCFRARAPEQCRGASELKNRDNEGKTGSSHIGPHDGSSGHGQTPHPNRTALSFGGCQQGTSCSRERRGRQAFAACMKGSGPISPAIRI